MDKGKPPIVPNEIRLRSASERTCADIHDAPARLTNSGEVAAEPQSRSGQGEPRGNEPSDNPVIAVYYRDEREVSEGFFIALRAMGMAIVEPSPSRPSIPSGAQARVRGASDG